MPEPSLARSFLLPELRLLHVNANARRGLILDVEKTSKMEVCPKCATPSESVYDHRTVRVRDDLYRGRQVVLVIHKRRFACVRCRRNRPL
jgi:transposase